MKKYVICLVAAALAITASAFTAPQKEKVKSGGYKWFDFNGNILQMGDPGYYNIDPDQFPDCFNTLGLVYCEIKAIPSEFDETVPDLSTICAVRYRPLL